MNTQSCPPPLGANVGLNLELQDRLARGKPPQADIAVVGAGVVGVCCALALQQAGKRVLLIDREGVGKGCSQGNAGHFATEQVLPLATPGLLWKIPGMLLDPLGPVAIRWSYLHRIAPWLIRFMLNTRQGPFDAGARALQVLNQSSLPAWRRLLGSLDLNELLSVEGSLLVFEQERTWQAYQPTLKQLRHYGVQLAELSGDQIRKLQPSLSPAINRGVFFPDTGHSGDPYQLTLRLANRFLERGGQLLQREVSALRCRENGVEISTPDATFQLPKLVLSTGAWSREFVRQLSGQDVPLDTERGYHLMLPKAGSELQIPVTSADRRFIMTPMSSGLRLAGTVEFGGLKAPPNRRRAHMLADHAKALVPNANQEIGEDWMGFRPSLPDSLPVIDRIGSQGQVLLAFGHQHLGLTQAAVTAELIVAMLAGEGSDIDLDPYRLQRFSTG